MVIDGERWAAFVPAAARWPVEAHLVPHHRANPPPYITGWHQAPVHTGRDLTRLHLQLFSLRKAPGRLQHLAGSESAVGAWVNDAVPEQIAARLRAAGP